ncbi:hypothetical protein NCS55_00725500 [Fusarium keratoplasticum]|nr:hypothetical protein NCS55_00725500 [Fusarium keratoplasticum]
MRCKGRAAAGGPTIYALQARASVELRVGSGEFCTGPGPSSSTLEAAWVRYINHKRARTCRKPRLDKRVKTFSLLPHRTHITTNLFNILHRPFLRIPRKILTENLLTLHFSTHQNGLPAASWCLLLLTYANFDTGGSTGHQARDCPTKGPAKCYNCGGEGHMSRDCSEPMKDNKSCYKCGQPGHISRDCPMSGGSGQATECYKCGELGHIARNCTKASFGNSYGGSGGFGGGAGKTCYSCGGYGHMSRECVNGMKCYNCGESGHYSRDCPKESAGGEKICYKCQQAGHVQAQCPNN